MATFLRGSFAHYERESHGTRLAPWLMLRDEHRGHEIVLASTVLATGRSLPKQTPALDKARGVPILGVGPGAMRGTTPDKDVPSRMDRMRERLDRAA